ncbi:MAG: S-layer homology domain-containing protein [bacterium]
MIVILAVSLAAFLLARQAGDMQAFAATTGTISSTNRYAWSENAGWIDFGTSEGNVVVSDTALTGYAWGENVGWVSLNCSNTSSCGTVDYKVTNDGEGTLGGHAWSENMGWILFSPDNGGVTINSSGIFSGWAWGENVGWITFNCSDTSSCATVDYKVSTGWRAVTGGGSAAARRRQALSNIGGGGGYFSSIEPPTVVTFNPNYFGLAQALKNAQEAALATESGAVLGRKTARAREMILASFLERMEQSQQVTEEREVFTQLIEEQGGPPESDQERKLLRAQAKTRIHASALPRSAPSVIAERRGLLAAVVDDIEVLYRDVPTDSWFAPYVASVIEEGIAQGYKDEEGEPTGEFGVSDPVTHAQVIKMALESSDNDLSDLPPPRNSSAQGTWASSYIARGEELQLDVLTSGLDVHASATRGEVIHTILEVLRIPLIANIDLVKESYKDLPASHPYAKAIITATLHGLIEGDTDENGSLLSTVRPNDHINRAEVAKIIALAKGLME